MRAENLIRRAQWWPLNGDTAGRRCGLRGSRGFTLIELLVVISMISILAAMGVVQYRNSVQRTQGSDPQEGSLRDPRRHRPVLRRQGQVPVVARHAGQRRLPAQDSRRSDHQLGRHLGDGARGSRSGQSVGRARHLQRQERRAGHVSRRHRLRGFLTAVGGSAGPAELRRARHQARVSESGVQPPADAVAAIRESNRQFAACTEMSRGFRLQPEGCAPKEKGRCEAASLFGAFSPRRELASVSACRRPSALSRPRPPSGRRPAVRSPESRRRLRCRSQQSRTTTDWRLLVVLDGGRNCARAEVPVIANDRRRLPETVAVNVTRLADRRCRVARSHDDRRRLTRQDRHCRSRPSQSTRPRRSRCAVTVYVPAACRCAAPLSNR